MESLLNHWPTWARPSQLAPEGDWDTWLFMAGRGAGKTRSGAEWIRQKIKDGCRYAGLIAPTSADARDVMVEGPAGMLAVCWDKDVDHRGQPIGRPLYEPSKRRLTWANGATATMFSADEPERLRGPQHEALWCDEIGAWRYAETWDLAMMGLRLGPRPQAIATTTPRPVRLVRDLLKDPGTVVTRGSTNDNRANLARTFLKAVERKYAGTRLGRQELMGELLEDTPGALWSRSNIDETRLRFSDKPDLSRIVVAIDPAVTSGEDADETGIVAVGRGRNDHGYVLEDTTMRGTPDAWARAAVLLHDRLDADCIVAETNQGGEMVALTIRTAAHALHRAGQRRSKEIAVRMVHTYRGKVLRAEPVSALYEQRRVHHVGALSKLEDQMCEFTSDFDRASMGYSPDRVDALVHGLTEVMLTWKSIPLVGPAGNVQQNYWGGPG